jgi:hypothetical protein
LVTISTRSIERVVAHRRLPADIQAILSAALQAVVDPKSAWAKDNDVVMAEPTERRRWWRSSECSSTAGSNF